MMKIKQKVQRFANKTLGLFPTKLPLGMTDFDRFCDSIFDTYELPNDPSYKHAIASMIMHLGPTVASKPKRFFALSVQKAMANQIAYQNIQLLKKNEATTEKAANELSI
jgi:hypothetical protein